MSEVQRNNINTFNFKHNGRVHSMNKYLMVLALLAVDLSDGQLSRLYLYDPVVFNSFSKKLHCF